MKTGSRLSRFGVATTLGLVLAGCGAPESTALSPAEAASVQVVGGPECQHDVAAALSLLETEAPSYYKRALANLAVIQCVTKGSGVEPTPEGGILSVGDKTRTESITWLAGAIVHDATHIELRRAYRQAHPGELGTPDTVWMGKEAEAQCLAVQAEAMELIDAPQAEISTVEHALDTRYWETPFENRHW